MLSLLPCCYGEQVGQGLLQPWATSPTAWLLLSGGHAAGSGHETIGLKGLAGKTFHLAKPQTVF